MKKIQISPSILSADFSQLGNEIKRLEDAGEFDYIIVDEAHHVGLEKASRYQKIFNNFNSIVTSSKVKWS